MGIRRLHVIDSHTGGEPTRIIVSGGPDLGSGSMAERRDRFRSQFDLIRSATVNEPRASDAVVGALLCEPEDPACAAGVIFFNNVGFIGMCGHGTMGLGATLQHLGRIRPGQHKIETVVGVVGMELHESGEVTVENVPSYRAEKDVVVHLEMGLVCGDIAWGGNWFFLTEDLPCELDVQHVETLTDYTWKIRQALARPEVDHIELIGPTRNFVLCPGRAYDRSPCGTGTSAKLACLYADGKLREGEVWRQESIIGSVFRATFSLRNGQLYPRITGTAYVNAEADLLIDSRDPFRWGIPA